MRKLIAILAVALAIPTMGFAEEQYSEEQYSEELCAEIYKRAKQNITDANDSWAFAGSDIAVFFASAAAHYATVYDIFCRQK